jgi:hypothetical protein
LADVSNDRGNTSKGTDPLQNHGAAIRVPHSGKPGAKRKARARRGLDRIFNLILSVMLDIILDMAETSVLSMKACFVVGK